MLNCIPIFTEKLLASGYCQNRFFVKLNRKDVVHVKPLLHEVIYKFNHTDLYRLNNANLYTELLKKEQLQDHNNILSIMKHIDTFCRSEILGGKINYHDAEYIECKHSTEESAPLVRDDVCITVAESTLKPTEQKQKSRPLHLVSFHLPEQAEARRNLIFLDVDDDKFESDTEYFITKAEWWKQKKMAWACEANSNSDSSDVKSDSDDGYNKQSEITSNKNKRSDSESFHNGLSESAGSTAFTQNPCMHCSPVSMLPQNLISTRGSKLKKTSLSFTFEASNSGDIESNSDDCHNKQSKTAFNKNKRSDHESTHIEQLSMSTMGSTDGMYLLW